MLTDCKGIAAGCDNAVGEVFGLDCNQQRARGKVNKGRCESIACSPSGRVLYMGWDNDKAPSPGGFLTMADTYEPTKIVPIKPGGKSAHDDMVKSISVDPHGMGVLTTSFDGTLKLWGKPIG
jgi:hypothetical protein